MRLTIIQENKKRKWIKKQGKNPVAIECTYELSEELLTEIYDEFGGDVFNKKSITISTKYSGKRTIGNVNVQIKDFWNAIFNRDSIECEALKSKLSNISTKEDFDALESELKEDELLITNNLNKYFESKNNWNDPIGEYIYRVLISPLLPKYLYYDEYYSLSSRINIEALQAETLDSDELKTAKALFELADINIDDLINSEDFEDFKAELEATEANISEELFEFWSSNNNLDIQFDIDKVEKTDARNNTRIIEHILDIRVKK